MFSGVAHNPGKDLQEHVVGGETLREAATVCRDHFVHQQAIAAIVGEITKYSLTWARGLHGSTRYTDKVDVPQWCFRFIEDAVESIAIAGYYAYVKRYGAAFVIPPETYSVTSSKKDKRWSILASSLSEFDKGAILIVYNTPRVTGCRSPAQSALGVTKRYNALEENLLQRDTLNSKHTVFTTISTQLQNQSGSTRQWFRSAVANDATHDNSMSIDTSFRDLIKRRADTVSRLRDATHQERERLKASAMPLGLAAGSSKDRLKEAVAAQQKGHVENIVTDGREFKPTTMLQSMSDGKAEMDRVYSNIMMCYGVPVQLFGKNINTERHAASNRLTESALDIFTRACKRQRALISTDLQDITIKIDNQSYVSFRRALNTEEVHLLSNVLKPKFAAMATAAAYDIPEGAIDLSKIAKGGLREDGGNVLEETHDQQSTPVAQKKPIDPREAGTKAAEINNHNI